MSLFKRKPPEPCKSTLLIVSTITDDSEEVSVASIYCAKERGHVPPCEIPQGVRVDVTDRSILWSATSTNPRLNL